MDQLNIQLYRQTTKLVVHSGDTWIGTIFDDGKHSIHDSVTDDQLDYLINTFGIKPYTYTLDCNYTRPTANRRLKPLLDHETRVPQIMNPECNYNVVYNHTKEYVCILYGAEISVVDNVLHVSDGNDKYTFENIRMLEFRMFGHNRRFNAIEVANQLAYIPIVLLVDSGVKHIRRDGVWSVIGSDEKYDLVIDFLRSCP